MDPARWRALEAAFETAHALGGEARVRWLAEREAEDAELARELRALLAADQGTGPLDRIGARLSSVRAVLADDARAPAEPPLPARVGPYVVSEEIGRGGMGVVCRAHDPRLGRDVALKIFPHAHGDDTERDAERRVLAEARAASALDHPHICTIHDVGALDDGRPFLAMAYYSGGTLAARIAAGPLAPDAAASIALQVAEALACAHAAGIVHRDVKPHNVAFAERGEAKLLDFGIALLRDQSGAGASGGTAAYMAPEQVRGDAVDGRADVWALGVVLFEMLTGKRPFAGADRAALLRAILRDDAPDVRTVRRDVPPALASIVARALARDPAARWPDAGTMALALRGVLAGERPAAPRRRRAAALLAGLAVVAAIAIAAAGWLALGDRGVSPAAAPDPAAELVARARARYLEASPEGLEEAITLLRLALSRTAMHGTGRTASGARASGAAESPARADAHALLARAYTVSTFEGRSRAGQAPWLDSAVVHARRAASLAPRSPEGWSALGVAYAALGQHDRAAAELRRAVELDPKHASAMMDLARSSAALGRYEDAVTWMERATRTNPGLPGGHARAVQRYRFFDLPDEAERHLYAGIHARPTEPYLRWEGILLALHVGDVKDARWQLRNYLPLVPPREHARLQALFALEAGDPRAARPWVDRAVGTATAADDLRAFGIVYALTGDRARADSLLGGELRRLRAESRDGRDLRRAAVFGVALLDLARVHAALGARDSALAALARWDSAGGMVAWRAARREPAWASVRDDPRFGAIVARSDARFQRARARLAARVAALRAEGAIPR